MFDARGCLVVCRVVGVALDTKWIFSNLNPSAATDVAASFAVEVFQMIQEELREKKK